MVSTYATPLTGRPTPEPHCITIAGNHQAPIGHNDPPPPVLALLPGSLTAGVVLLVHVRGDLVEPRDGVRLLVGLAHAHERRLGADVLRSGDVDSKCKNNFVLVTKREIYPSVTSIIY